MRLFYTILFSCLLIFPACSLENFNTEKALSAGIAKAEISLPLSTTKNKKTLLNPVKVAKKAARISTFFRNRHQQGRFNGTVLFAEQGQVIYKDAFGYSNLRTKESLKVNSAFQLASVSKPLTAIAIMQLQEQGLLSYQDDLQKFFPELPYEGITVWMLLSHRAGLANYMYFADDHWPQKKKPLSNDDVLEIMAKHKPKIYYAPDQRYHYSNTGYALLASIVEQVSGEDFDVYMDNHVFEPAGMTDAFIFNKCKNPKLPKTTIGYNGRLRQKENHYQNGVVGDKGVYASVEDLFKLDRALYNGTLLETTTLEEAFLPVHPDLERRGKDNYGYGFRIREREDGSKYVYHTGWWKGYKTCFIRLLDSESTIIVLTNVTRGGTIRVKELENLLFPNSVTNKDMFVLNEKK